MPTSNGTPAPGGGWDNAPDNYTSQYGQDLTNLPALNAHMPKGMTRDDFIKKFGATFTADDKGGNSASEVARQDTGAYYDKYLTPDAKRTYTMNTGWDGGGINVPVTFGEGRYADALPGFDAWDNVNPHPQSNRGDGLDEAWKAVGRPIATAVAMYYGVGALAGMAGGTAAGSAATAGGTGVGGSAGSPKRSDAQWPLWVDGFERPLCRA